MASDVPRQPVEFGDNDVALALPGLSDGFRELCRSSGSPTVARLDFEKFRRMMQSSA
jgi:hypothetical protein